MLIGNLKKSLRQKYKAIAQSLDWINLTPKIFNHIKPLIASAKCIAAYWPLFDEPLCLPFLKECEFILLPYVYNKDTAFEYKLFEHKKYIGEGLIQDKMGIPLPPLKKTHLQPDVILVPGLAFDQNKRRLGRGGGYYDRTLAEIRLIKPSVITIGVISECQLCPALPYNDYDQVMDFLVTDKKILN